MTFIYIGILLFGGAHLFSVLAPAIRNRLKAWIGENAFKGLYALISVLGVIALAYGYILTRTDGVMAYQPFTAARHLTMSLVLIGFVLMSAAYAKSHIRKWLQNPFSLGVAFWATGHLLANGKIAVVLIYATLLVIAILDIVANMLRGNRPGFDPVWNADIRAVIGGVVIYAIVLFAFHPYVLGVPVIR